MVLSNYSIATLEVSETTFHEIATKLQEAGYDHAFIEGGFIIDMHGLGLKSRDPTHHVEKDDHDKST